MSKEPSAKVRKPHPKGNRVDNFAKLRAEMNSRCEASSLSFKEIECDPKYLRMQVKLNNGRSKRAVKLGSQTEIKNFLSIPFENYIFLGRYDAICSYKDGYIEAGLQILSEHANWQLREALFGKCETEEDMNEPEAIEIKPDAKLQRPYSAAIGTPSKEYSIIARGSARLLTLTIKGISVSQHDQAVDILETLHSAIFFALDNSLGISVGLKKGYQFVRSDNGGGGTEAQDHWKVWPKYQYDFKSMSFYWCAQSAYSMPTLRYLLFYQVIEYYYPLYSQKEVIRKIGNMLKSPRFNADKELDVVAIVNAVSSSSGSSFDERSQLKTTINACLSADELRKFIKSDKEREVFLSSDKILSKHHPNLNMSDEQLRNEASERIYEIRCRIAHSKSSDDSDTQPIVPFSKESEQLIYDTELIQFICQLVLAAGSRSLTLA